jgi:hypothetical protein
MHEAKEMVHRQFGYQFVKKLGKFVHRISTDSQECLHKTKELFGRKTSPELDEVPKTTEQLDKEKRQQMETSEFWMELLKTCRLTDAQLAKLRSELAGALTDTGRKEMYFEQLDEMKATFAQIFANLESDMSKQVEQLAVERQQQQQRQQNEIIEEGE